MCTLSKYYPAVHELPLIYKNELSTDNKSTVSSKKMLNINKKLEIIKFENDELLIEQILKIIS